MPRVTAATLRELRPYLTDEQWAALKDGTADIAVLASSTGHSRIDIPSELRMRKVSNGKVSCFWHSWKTGQRHQVKVERVRICPDDIWYLGDWNDLHRESEAAKTSAQRA
jgi:hypothetical protein